MREHRNVIFNNALPPYPFTSIDSDRPEDLWAFLTQMRAHGDEALAITGHPNGSMGLAFRSVDSKGQAIDASHAGARALNEPLIEISQAGGQSEAHPALSPADEFASFELGSESLSPDGASSRAGSYARYALSLGMKLAEENGGVNPYQFGFVGSSDFHTGRSESAESAEAYASSGSLTGAWAEQNTRESLYAAFRRKETFATSGTRIKLRFFGGWKFPKSLLEDREWVKTAYRDGVPMGGNLPAQQDAGQAPVFIVWASKDPIGANLDRVQIVKVWLEEGRHAEQVYDVALSDGRLVDPRTGRAPAVGNTVDLQQATYTNTIGASTLAALWADPHFDPKVPSAYYSRVLEIPTPRWTTFKARRAGDHLPKNTPAILQERGWSSPIWFTPQPTTASSGTK